MSGGKKIGRDEALGIAKAFMVHIADAVQWYCIAGSIRRERAYVGDIEIVVEPNHLGTLLARLDGMVRDGVIHKAMYGRKGTPRWGQSYRGCAYRGVTVEVFVCDVNNRGYTQWLRTGDGRKNQYVMSRLIACKSPVRFSDGYGWHVTYDRKHPRFDVDRGYAKLGKLIIPDEFTLYWLLGMKPIVPQHRRQDVYARQLGQWVNCPSDDLLVELYVPDSAAPTQKALF